MNGMALPPSRFSPFFDPPNPHLVDWHYRQAIMARVRGFSVGMRPSEIVRTVDVGRWRSNDGTGAQQEMVGSRVLSSELAGIVEIEQDKCQALPDERTGISPNSVDDFIS